MASSDIVNFTDGAIFHDNVIIMEIDNLLSGWPSYEVNFTPPQNPGPMKLIIHLKDASKLARLIELEDSASDNDSAEELLPRPAKKLKAGKQLSCRLEKGFASISLSESDTKDAGENSDATTAIVSDISSPNLVKAEPVHLMGILKDPASLKRKFSDNEPWPPRRSRAFRQISSSQSVSRFQKFRTSPAAVTAGKDNGSHASFHHAF